MLRLLSVLLIAFSAGASAAPRVVADIPPVHALVAAVMEGVGAPTLLVRNPGGAHHRTLRPSEAEMLGAADVVFWIGPGLSPWLARAIDRLAAEVDARPLMEAEGLILLAARESGVWAGDHDHDHDHEHEGEAEKVDPHLWLDPQNAAALLDDIAARLSALDPERAATYRANADREQAAIAALSAEIDGRLSPVRAIPFLVLHDALHYFEDRFSLTSIGAVTDSHADAPGPRRLETTTEAAKEAACVFEEPGGESGRLLRGAATRRGVLDPLGVTLEAGPGLYRVLLAGLATEIAECLAGAG